MSQIDRATSIEEAVNAGQAEIRALFHVLQARHEQLEGETFEFVCDAVHRAEAHLERAVKLAYGHEDPPPAAGGAAAGGAAAAVLDAGATLPEHANRSDAPRVRIA